MDYPWLCGGDDYCNLLLGEVKRSAEDYYGELCKAGTWEFVIWWDSVDFAGEADCSGGGASDFRDGVLVFAGADWAGGDVDRSGE